MKSTKKRSLTGKLKSAHPAGTHPETPFKSRSGVSQSPEIVRELVYESASKVSLWIATDHVHFTAYYVVSPRKIPFATTDPQAAFSWFVLEMSIQLDPSCANSRVAQGLLREFFSANFAWMDLYIEIKPLLQHLGGGMASVGMEMVEKLRALLHEYRTPLGIDEKESGNACPHLTALLHKYRANDAVDRR